MIIDQPEWFESWFDSPYYHILYKNRDTKEAENFINNLLNKLHLQVPSKVLDLACGKGRHSTYLHEIGHDVIGIDLSEQNIDYCKQFESEKLMFYQHDMRKIFRTNYFDAVFNLFTSFGYFEQDHQNQLAITAASINLKKGGYLIIDFFNAVKAVKSLIHHEKKTMDGIEFTLDKKVENDLLIKEISFKAQNKSYSFKEEVKILNISDFQRFYEKAGLEIIEMYGNYQLEAFESENSSRLIMLTKKI